ncbi:MAG: RsmE family RNA methyltransferase [Nitrospinota bacterium]
MRLFFVEEGQISGERVEIAGSEARHMVRALRMAPGERCRVSDGRGRAYLVELTSVGPRRVEARVEEELPAPDPSRRLALGQGLPRAAKFDLILQKAAELGAAEVYPLHLARCLDRGTG